MRRSTSSTAVCAELDISEHALTVTPLAGAPLSPRHYKYRDTVYLTLNQGGGENKKSKETPVN